MRLESFDVENIDTSRLSENHAESLSASPLARYFDIGLNTSYPLSCAESEEADAKTAAEAINIDRILFI